MASDHIPDAGKEVDSNLEVIRWRSCEEDKPDNSRTVLLTDGELSWFGWWFSGDPGWHWADRSMRGKKPGMWAEMPRGPK